jgi:hypothetical protein
MIDEDMAQLAYQAARQIKYNVVFHAGGSNQVSTIPEVVTVWLDNENNVFIASSGGNSVHSAANNGQGAHAEDNIIYLSKGQVGGGEVLGSILVPQPDGLRGGKLISWNLRYGLYHACDACAIKLAEQGRPKDLWYSLTSNGKYSWIPKAPPAVEGYVQSWDDDEKAWKWQNIYDKGDNTFIYDFGGGSRASILAVEKRDIQNRLPRGWTMDEAKQGVMKGHWYYTPLFGERVSQWKYPRRHVKRLESVEECTRT